MVPAGAGTPAIAAGDPKRGTATVADSGRAGKTPGAANRLVAATTYRESSRPDSGASAARPIDQRSRSSTFTSSATIS